jgi:hypothetical protein
MAAGGEQMENDFELWLAYSFIPMAAFIDRQDTRLDYYSGMKASHKGLNSSRPLGIHTRSAIKPGLHSAVPQQPIGSAS